MIDISSIKPPSKYGKMHLQVASIPLKPYQAFATCVPHNVQFFTYLNASLPPNIHQRSNYPNLNPTYKSLIDTRYLSKTPITKHTEYQQKGVKMHLRTSQILLLAFASLFALTSAAPRHHKGHHSPTTTPTPASVPTPTPPEENYAGVSAAQQYCEFEQGSIQGCY